MFEIVLFQSYLFLSQIFRWANLVSEEERNETRITFCTDPLFFRTWLRMLARPPWRTTIKVMGSEYLEPDIPSHERFGAPSNLRATAFPPFLDCSRSLSFQTESRFNGWFDGRFFFFFRKLSCRRHWNFFFTQQSDFCQHSRKEYFVKVERLCLFFEIFNFNFNFWGYVARHRLKENIVTSRTI